MHVAPPPFAALTFQLDLMKQVAAACQLLNQQVERWSQWENKGGR